MHPRNRHTGRYDFQKLTQAHPELAPFVARNPYGDESIDFADPRAVKALNRALLASFYGILHWDIPEDYLCPPIPGRADYIHNIADLLASSNDELIPRGPGIRVLDIGVGANCVYPIIGQGEYGWSFVGTESDPVALASARKIVEAEPGLRAAVELRLQSSAPGIFKGVVKPGELFDLTVCNPPFHSSLEEAQEGSRRKWRNLGKEESARNAKGKTPVLNFGGQNSELWCPGGEVAFIRRMIEESARIGTQCFWFSSLVSKESNLPALYAALESVDAHETGEVEMEQGQKKSRLIAWTFLNAGEQQEWKEKRWAGLPGGAK